MCLENLEYDGRVICLVSSPACVCVRACVCVCVCVSVCLCWGFVVENEVSTVFGLCIISLTALRHPPRDFRKALILLKLFLPFMLFFQMCSALPNVMDESILEALQKHTHMYVCICINVCTCTHV